jgi:hypothetical protein
MDQAIGEILPLVIGVTNTFAHLGAFSSVFHLLATRLLAVVGITLELLVLNTLWPRTETTIEPT